jgi:diacylglycerol kinase family enzyme
VWRRGAAVEATALGEPPWVEIDGEPLGRLPARVEILPKALRFVGCGPLAG